MSTSAMRNRYVTDAVETVSPGRLVVMLYDRLVLDLDRAGEAIDHGSVEGAHRALVHAQEIVSELHAALDTSRWPAATALAALYRWLHEGLVAANVSKDRARVRDCRAVVEPLRDAWREAAGLAGTVSGTPDPA